MYISDHTITNNSVIVWIIVLIYVAIKKSPTTTVWYGTARTGTFFQQCTSSSLILQSPSLNTQGIIHSETSQPLLDASSSSHVKAGQAQAVSICTGMSCSAGGSQVGLQRM